MSINKCFLGGNITNQPELRSTPGGMAILEFGLAVNERRKNQQTGEWEERPNFFNLKVFGTRGEALSRILTKGMHVSVEGRLHWDSWEDKNTGQKRSKVEVIVDEIELMTQRQNGPQAAPQPGYAAQQQRMYANPPQQQMPPQMPSQAPAAPMPPQYGNYQPTRQPPMQQQIANIYDEDIPFADPYML